MSTQNDSISDVLVIKGILKKAFVYKYLYIACFVLCFAIAYGVNRFSTIIYEASSIIGPSELEPSQVLGSSELFAGMEAYTQVRNIEDDISKIKTFPLVAETINKLSLDVGYFIQDNKFLAQKRFLYNSAPYIISIDKSHIQPMNILFFIQILDAGSFRLTAKADQAVLYNYIDKKITGIASHLEIDTICRFNETVSNNNFKFVILNNPDIPQSAWMNDLHFFEFYYNDNLTQRFISRIVAEPVNSRSSLIRIRFIGENPDLIVDFLNTYIQTILEENLSKKNQTSINSIKFIDSQISEISDSLMASEEILRDYRSTNRVTDLGFQGQQALEQMSQVESELSSLKIQERYYEYILDYLDKNQDFAGLSPPSANNVTDPIMNTMILGLLDLNAQRSAILSRNADKNLYLDQIESKIKLNTQTISQNVKNNLNTLNLNKNELNYRAEKLSKEISRLPKTELNMVSMQRKFNLTDAIYTYLLQKRSEAAITMASNYPDYEILETARTLNISVLSPRRRINWIIAFFFSVMVPSLYVILKNSLINKFSSVHEVEDVANSKVLNTIYKHPYKTEAVVSEFPVSLVTESFRNLRSSLFMRFREKPLKVILITSCQPQDGKSFISFNLATSIAMAGYKSIILDGDMRKPTLHKNFETDNQLGLTNYMADHASIESIIKKTKIENLSFIPAGPALPNTSELIESGSLKDLIGWLNEKYEYIIIDTTPAGLVSDSILLMKYASIVLLIVRNEVTRKDDLKEVLNIFQVNKIESYEIVYNDMNTKESRQGRHNSYYTIEQKRKPYGK